jgi:hypothetical protein
MFASTLVPYALWNRANHGVFTPTPLEGGGGVFNLGYWCGRIPGYPKERAFENFVSDEMVRFVPASELANDRFAYEREWDAIDARLAPLLTRRDSAMRAIIAGRPSICYSHNTRYTLERERLLKDRTLSDIGEHPVYYFAWKCYSAVRLWVVGVDRGRFAASGWGARAGMVAAFLFTLAVLVGGITFLWKAHRRGNLPTIETWPALLWVVYTTAIHLPFVIQTRYTSSARPVLLMLMAASACALVLNRSSNTRTTTPDVP